MNQARGSSGLCEALFPRKTNAYTSAPTAMKPTPVSASKRASGDAN